MHLSAFDRRMDRRRRRLKLESGDQFSLSAVRLPRSPPLWRIAHQDGSSRCRTLTRVVSRAKLDEMNLYSRRHWLWHFIEGDCAMYALKLLAAAGVFALVCLTVSTTFAQEPTREHAQNASPKPRLEISKETTVIDGPLTEDGYVDYLAALNEHASHGVTPENNAVVLLMQAVGPSVVEEKVRAEFFQKLGVEVPPAEGDYWVPLSEIHRQHAKAAGEDPKESFNALYEQLAKAMAGPWSAEQYPELAKWLAANEKPLAIVGEAAKRPRFYMPRVAPTDDGQIASTLTLMLSLIQEEREAGRALMVRAMLRLERGEIEGAWSDLHTLHRLARLVGQGEVLVDALVGIALHLTAVDASATLLHEGKLTPEQIQQIAADLAKLPPLPKMSEKFDVGERYFFLDFVTTMARKGPAALEEQLGAGAEITSMIGKLVSATALDWNLIARRGNHWYDRIVDAAQSQPHAERTKALAKLEEDLQKLRKQSQEVGSWARKLLFAGGNLRQVASEQLSNTLVSLIAPAVQAAIVAEERAHTQTRLLQIAVALAAYRAEHGAYPETLDELSDLPTDLYTGEPFRYRRTDEGYLLYSVGPNLKDDNGAGFEHRPHHDIVLRQPAKASD